SYVRAEDPSLLAELLGDKRCRSLGLRPLAATVLAATADPDEVLAVLRAVGVAPAAEGPAGELLLRRATALRSGPRPVPRPVTGEPPVPAHALLSAAVRSLRAGDDDAADVERRRGQAPDAPALAVMDPTTSLALLREAASRRRAVWIGYVDGEGAARRHLVEPVGVEGGRITAVDRAEQTVRSYSVHRITGVAAADA
ncbi:DNA-binding protein, partial [Kineococcus sp. R8]